MRLSQSRSVSAVITVAALLFAFAGTARLARAQGKQSFTETQVLDVQKKFQDASVAGDAATLSALMADDALFIHGSAAAQTKAQYIASVSSGQLKLTTYESKDSKVVFFDGGAIVSGLTDVGLAPPPTAPADTPPRLLHMRVSTVWIQTPSGLQLILNQGTPLAPPPPPGTPNH
ncbi:MAG: nuclear transport factor 2 family protein [Candidatus Acidiferrales bacterium]|jgi:ketosteroid isomerase-like protein